MAAALTAHRSFSASLRSELYQNICLLSLRRPLLEDLCEMLTGGPQALEKLNQALLIHLSYYLATIIEPRMAQFITWPLYDKKSERTYKIQLLSFLSMFFNKDGSAKKDKLITPIQPSYLNAGGFKVLYMLFEMSQLALIRLIRDDFDVSGDNLEACDLSKFLKDEAHLETATEEARKQVIVKGTDFLTYKKNVVKLSEHYKSSINELEKQNEILTNTLEKCVNILPKTEAEHLKSVKTPSAFLCEWNDYGDRALARMEFNWSEKTRAFIESSTSCRQAGKMNVLRSTVPDKSSFTIEYIPGRDDIAIDELEMQVSSQQRYVLKNIVKDNKLNFPALIQGYTVAICFLFKNVRCLEPLGLYGEVLSGMTAGYSELVKKGKFLVDGMHTLEMKLQKKSPQPFLLEESGSELVVPPLPDFRIQDKPWQSQLFRKAFTPLHSSKILFDMRKTPNVEMRQPRLLFQAPVHAVTRPLIFKKIAKLHAENLVTSICSNTSKSSQPDKPVNRTFDCSAGFTKEQFQRLLSSRKSTGKKFMPMQKTNSHSKAKRSCLFKETPENSFTMTRSISSPNICISTELKRRTMAGHNVRDLYAIAQEESPDRPMEISGIACLQSSGHSQQHCSSLSERYGSFKSMPSITVSKPEIQSPRRDSCTATVAVVEQINETLNASKDFENNSRSGGHIVSEEVCKTPNATRNTPLEKVKGNSIEKLIERYRRIQRNAVKMENTSLKLSPITDDPIMNTKENNANEIKIDTSFAIPLPDLVSPSCNNLSNRSSGIKSEWPILNSPPMKDKKYKCRESLGTVLGVDNTFLDQYNLDYSIE